VSTPYRPIACGLHDELLAFATRRCICEIVVRSGETGELRSVRTRILDVFTKGSEEFARLESGETVRLDRLERVDGSGPEGQ
jgi:transcriptional antiterminator Rof (Rho-off)